MSQVIIANKKQTAIFVYEEEAFSGVNKIADWVRRDICLVTDKEVGKIEAVNGSWKEEEWTDAAKGSDEREASAVIFGTVGKSPILNKMEQSGKLDLSKIAGKREVYQFSVMEEPIDGIKKALVIAGSDKRGTIYGLLHISELLGVSPFVDWSDVKPPKQEEVSFDESVNMVSKEPSVKYRGFFINDEWPAFGTFCEKHFGGMNAQMYEMIFLLMLRLKGNYLWPAMWATCFAVEGPGLASADLADEYGIVMGLSHHEPCLRHGEEYSKLRGKDSPYGDAWNFRKNREGITRFWRDGLKRNGHLENVITLGMRGERDSAIMGKEATLGDNIDLLRDVITTQNTLIREEVNENIEDVPRMLALYKEVEPFFYGDDTFEGLMGDPCLSDVILLLCDDNHGYLRSRPDQKMLEHNGGYGLYYHFDYHGEPVSYEWVNSSYLPQVWEQLTEAYETGIRDLWIVNVGDLAFQEFPLSYFMEMAYDYDAWGIRAVNQTGKYTKEWVEKQFAADFSKEQKEKLCQVLHRFTRLNHNRRPEHMNETIYHPVHDKEAERIHEEALELIAMVEELEQCCKVNRDAFQQLVAYQVKASMNYICMCLYRGWNHLAAAKGLVIANDFADKIQKCMEIDEKLRDDFHQLNGSKWDGLASASHIGFCNWNDEEAKNPIIETVLPIRKSRLVVGTCENDKTTCGEEWTRKRLYVNALLNPLADKAEIYVGLCCDHAVEFSVSCEDERIQLSASQGRLCPETSLQKIEILLQRDKLGVCGEEPRENPVVEVRYANACAQIEILMPDAKLIENVRKTAGENVFIETDGVVCMHASHCVECMNQTGEYFETLEEIGKTTSGVKLYTEKEKLDSENPSWLAYDFYVLQEGTYELVIETQPASARKYCGNISVGYSINDEAMQSLVMLPEGYEPGVSSSWEEGVLDHVRRVNVQVHCNSGKNRIRYYALSEENVVERILLIRTDKKLASSYLGPMESIQS